MKHYAPNFFKYNILLQIFSQIKLSVQIVFPRPTMFHAVTELRRLLSTMSQVRVLPALLIVNDKDPQLFLEQLRPIIERNFTYWITEDGPQTWRIIFSRSESS